MALQPFSHTRQGDEAIVGNANYSAAVKTARNYYNSSDADRFYLTLWGGRDLHIGLYKSDEESVLEASNRTTCRMAELVADRLEPGARVLDVGGGFGGTVRVLGLGCARGTPGCAERWAQETWGARAGMRKED